MRSCWLRAYAGRLFFVLIVFAVALPISPASATVPQRPFLETFGSAAQPAFTEADNMAFDAANGDLLVVDRSGIEEEQKLTIEAASGLGGTYELSLAGENTGWKGQASLVAGETAVTGMVTTSGKLSNGEAISGTGIQPGTTVSNVNEGAGTFTLSQPATTTGTSSDLKADLPFDASESVMKEALGKLPVIGPDGLNVVGAGTNSPIVRSLRFWGMFPRLYTRDIPAMGCDPSGLTGTSPSCTVTVTQAGHSPGVYRYHKDGTPAPFSGLGTNLIDGLDGVGAKPCAEESESCDQTPQGTLQDEGGLIQGAQVAVDESGTATDGDIYVAVKKQHVVDIFAPDGHYLGQLSKYTKGAVESTLGESGGVAVDATGNVYVADRTRNLVHKYSPKGGEHDPLTNADSVANFATTEPRNVAAGFGPTAGWIFVQRESGEVKKYDGTTGTVQYTVAEGLFPGYWAVAVNRGNGHVFAAKQNAPGPAEHVVNEYDASGSSGATLLSQAVLLEDGRGLAVDPASDRLYVAEEFQTKVSVYAPSLKPAVKTELPSGLGGTEATLNGAVNPKGTALTSCSFEWGTTEAPYEHSEPCAESPGEIGTGEAPVPVHIDLTGLTPGTHYHYRVSAANGAGSSNGEDASFITPRPPAIAEESVLSAAGGEATLRAKVNPEGFATTYTVEYGTTEAYGQATAPVSLGAADGAFHQVVVHLEGLVPSTTYHFRFSADNTNPSVPGTGVEAGEDRTFATFAPPTPRTDCPNQVFRGGSAALLPDCRAYEMVSPVDKENGDITPLLSPLGRPAVLDQASIDGNRFAYGTFRAFGDASTAPFMSQYVAARTEAGWVSHSILPPRRRLVVLPSGTTDTELKQLSPDLCQAWVRNLGDPPQEGGLAGYVNIYRRTDQECGGPSYEALTMEAPYILAPPYEVAAAGSLLALTFEGASADGSAALYAARDNLSADAPTQPSACVTAHGLGFGGACQRRLYYRQEGGAPHYVCVLPDGAPLEGSCAPGSGVEESAGETRTQFLRGAISDDGSRVFWTAGAGGAGELYLRENPAAPESAATDGEGNCLPEAERACTIDVSKEAEEISGAGGAVFLAASGDGSKVFFRTGGDLYQFEVEGRNTTLLAHKSEGLLGASEDGAWVYLESAEALSGENGQGQAPVAGKPNLYAYHEGAYRFVATLSPQDVAQGSGYSAVTDKASSGTSYVSADGAHAAFMSQAPLTGYDNTDAASAKEDTEAFVYDAEADEGQGRLACASCNPSGARPVGRFINEGVNDQRWVAGILPIWESSLYAPHPLSPDGSRVFFESTDALSPLDTDGARDVYEWEAPGSGTCEEGAADYSAQNEGCVDLISTGQNARDSHLLDASPDGRDVFFTTLSSLVKSDPGLVDVYDARAEGGLPEPPAPPAQCEGEGCQSPPGIPPHPNLGSAALEGAGNVRETPPHHKKHHHKKHRRHKHRAKRHGRAGR
jgi:hypothetical protein